MSSPKKRVMDYSALAARQVERDMSAAAAGPDRFERAQTALAGPPALLEVDAILARQLSTRGTDAGHVKSLAESIAALGLIEPVVVDTARRLLAGGHRLEAIKWLRSDRPDVFAKWFSAGIPVRVMDFDADVSPSRALEVEVAENEHRRDYTVSQVKDLVGRLKDAGYRDTVGRPKAGEKALGPALEVIVGKSMKTIRKWMNGEEGEGATEKPATEHPLESALRAILKQRRHIPATVLPQFEALVCGIEGELRSRQA